LGQRNKRRGRIPTIAVLSLGWPSKKKRQEKEKKKGPSNTHQEEKISSFLFLSN